MRIKQTIVYFPTRHDLTIIIIHLLLHNLYHKIDALLALFDYIIFSCAIRIGKNDTIVSKTGRIFL